MTRRLRLALAGVLMLAAAGAGCNIVGPAVYFIGGPAKVKPQFTLPDDRPAVVFVDDRGSVLPTRATRQRIAQTAERTLLDGKAVSKSEIISSDSVLTVSAQERFGKPLGIAEVGRAVGAKTVVYATVEQFTLSLNGQEFEPTAKLRVKVIDSESRRRLWPGADREWFELTIKPERRSANLPRTLAERSNAEYALAEETGRGLGRLFVEYVSEDVAKRVGD